LSLSGASGSNGSSAGLSIERCLPATDSQNTESNNSISGSPNGTAFYPPGLLSIILMLLLGGGKMVWVGAWRERDWLLWAGQGVAGLGMIRLVSWVICYA